MRGIKDENKITELIQKDSWMVDVLKAAEELNLPDWWIGAGFLRNKIWDYIENKESEPTRDVDLVYFDNRNMAQEIDWDHDRHMSAKYPFAEWEIRNQARMHYVNGFEPFTSTEDGISHWVETATCVGVRLQQGQLEYLFCYGTDDLYGMIARPTPYFKKAPLVAKFFERVEQKKWQARWPDLRVKLD